ncbi:NAD(P)-binding domain-containing protein [Macrococcoides canis]|uniref:NAD(P)-binding domain-containing protein n=1 Tax=Macrococcoides canis TaxID=1855823 RepID=A0A1W7ACM5_9STAP|nr:NAD(P)-dependent oxidoreductase [Macrococcus canis]ARQ07387.1 hypothetical protein MCCS_17530 [Macrococcus canis]
MKIGVVAATGKVGRLVVDELISRGYEPVAIVRDAHKVTQKIKVIEKDIFDLRSDDVSSFDIIVNAFGAPLGEEEAHVKAGRVLIDALKGTDTRLIVVGGAGSLYVDDAESVTLVESGNLPDIFMPSAKGQARNYEDIKQAEDLTWTFISPAGFFDPEGKKTGNFTLGKDKLMVNSQGESYISYHDFVTALVDEIEHPQHINQRFTLVGEKA